MIVLSLGGLRSLSPSTMHRDASFCTSFYTFLFLSASVSDGNCMLQQGSAT